MIEQMSRILAKHVLIRWPSVVENVTKGLQPLVGLLAEKDAEAVASTYAEWNTPPTADTAADMAVVGLDDASEFVRQMAVVEGGIRLRMVAAGCNCKMDLQAQIVQAHDPHCLVQVVSLHEPICGWIQKMRLDHSEFEESDPEDETG